jgi:hypothetical protein
MQVGELREVVVVQANMTTRLHTEVDTFSSTVKEVVNSGRVREPPLNGPQTIQQQSLPQGAVSSAASLIAINPPFSFAVNGTRANSSSYTLDGGLSMDACNNPAAFPTDETPGRVVLGGHRPR